MKAIWNNKILAESAETVLLEGNHYFPIESLNKDHFKESSTTTLCPWKGIASYYSVTVNECKNEDAAWFYKQPKEAAKQIINHVAFWKGVSVEK